MSDTNDPGKPTPPESPVPPVPPTPPQVPTPPAPPTQPKPPRFEAGGAGADEQPTTALPQADDDRQPTSVLPGFEQSPYNGAPQGAAASDADRQATTALPQADAPQPEAPQFGAAPPAPPVPPVPPAPGAGLPGEPAPGYPGAPQQPAGYAYPAGPVQPKGLAITALVLGIVAVAGAMIFGWIPFVGGVITVLVAAAALILGIIALKQRQPKGMSLTGTILGGVGLLVGLGIIIAWGFIFSSVSSEVDRYSTELEEQISELESTVPDSSDLDSLTEDPGATDTTPGSTGERSAEFCTAFDTAYAAIDPSTDTWSAAELAPFAELGRIDSPNREIYARVGEVASDPSLFQSPEYVELLSDFGTALWDDEMACL